MHIRIATDEDRLQIYRDVHPQWGASLPLETFLERRLASPRHNRPTWWCLHDGTRIVASLGCHPLRFQLDGVEIHGCGFAAVYTHPTARRRGYARGLCEHVMQHTAERGGCIALLFSDIAPAYYERMGFRVAPHDVWTVPTELLQPTTAPAYNRLDPARSLCAFQALYTHTAHQHPLTIARNLDDWRYSIAANPGDLFFRLPLPNLPPNAPFDPQTHGVLRIAYEASDVEIVELHLPLSIAPTDPTALSLRASAWRFAGRFAHEREIPCVTSWHQPPPTLSPHATHAHRSQAITMIASLKTDLDPPTPRAWICSSDHF